MRIRKFRDERLRTIQAEKKMQVKVQEVRKYLMSGEHGVVHCGGKKKAARGMCWDMKKRKADIKYHITKGLNARVRK